jgi:hypothetical protein
MLVLGLDSLLRPRGTQRLFFRRPAWLRMSAIRVSMSWYCMHGCIAVSLGFG